jgi:hypothetical protein
VALLGIVSGYMQTARAQGATTNVQATVLQAITVTPIQNLTFGNVFPGVAKAIPSQSGSGGRFQATGQPNANISLSLTLPANLVSGTNLLPVGSWTGRHNTVVTGAGSAPTFNPLTGVNTTFSATGFRYVFLGGTVTPAANQAAGLYTAVATLTVTYF